MSTTDRKAAIAAYKERKTRAGIYAVRCAPAKAVWIGESRHIDTHRNGLWFALKHGSYPNPALQAAWRTHGEAAFTFEAIEILDDGLTPYLQGKMLKERRDHWRAALQARPA